MPEYTYICPECGRGYTLDLRITDDIPPGVLCEDGAVAVRVYDVTTHMWKGEKP
jgi:predicted nucleic acid-binding Zn ribbon protein